ncbi:hypothetical protein T03_10234 [Trichinella britovi]|uniref:Uncharacterized protein n=1 Tax=Trichinella britovi TaxID=45882 RepID=A0A0V1CAM1_TRIBR|nr:hypothetical protein T03_10234 [Trichinella britovi]
MVEDKTIILNHPYIPTVVVPHSPENAIPLYANSSPQSTFLKFTTGYGPSTLLLRQTELIAVSI